MRRWIVPSSLVFLAALTAAIGILAIAGSATAAPRAPRIACPQSGHIVPCCPQPVDAQTCCPMPTTCCPSTTTCCSSSTTCCTTACCPTPTTCCQGASSGSCCTPTPCPTGSLTISASPDPSTAGQKVVISGAVVGTPVAGAQVVLWRELAGQSSFQQVAQTTTDGAGQYSFALQRGTVMADQAWYVTSNGMQSSTVHQLVAALVGLTASTRSTVVGHTIALRGHVTPSHARGVVLVEVKHGGTWRVIARPHLGRGSSYSVSHHFAQAGSFVLRAVLPANSRNALSASRSVNVTVKQ